MGNHEYCTECGATDFHLGRPCDPKRKAEYQKKYPVKPKTRFGNLNPGEVIEYLNLDGDPKKAIIAENRAGNYRVLTFNGRDISVKTESIKNVLAKTMDEYLSAKEPKDCWLGTERPEFNGLGGP